VKFGGCPADRCPLRIYLKILVGIHPPDQLIFLLPGPTFALQGLGDGLVALDVVGAESACAGLPGGF
jgi:hypothetical protein